VIAEAAEDLDRAMPSWLTSYAIDVAAALRISMDRAVWEIPLVWGLAARHHTWCAAELTCHWIIERAPLEDQFKELADAEFYIH
jgi:hypothetical protein